VGTFHEIDVPNILVTYSLWNFICLLAKNYITGVFFVVFIPITGVRMTSIGVCSDTSDAVELLEAQGLYVKPVAKLNISVQLPQLKSPGASISNWEVMEKLKKMIKPDSFLVLKVFFITCSTNVY